MRLMYILEINDGEQSHETTKKQKVSIAQRRFNCKRVLLFISSSKTVNHPNCIWVFLFNNISIGLKFYQYWLFEIM